MGVLTSRLKLRKPSISDPPLITDLDRNWDILDQAAITTNNGSDFSSMAATRLNLRVPTLSSAVAVATTNVSALNTYMPVIDGVSVFPGMQVLLTAQTNAKQNGPWVVSNGPGFAWTRPADFGSGFKLGSRLIGITGGTVGANQIWQLSTMSQLVVDTDAQTWVKINLTLSQLDARYAALQATVNVQTSVSGTYTIPDVTTATVHDLTLTGNTTFTLPTAAAGKSIMVKFRQDATGSRVPMFSGVTWPVGALPSFSTGPNKVDKVAFDCTNATEGWEATLIGLDYSIPRMTSLKDPFTGTSLDTTKWTQTTAGAGSMSYSSAGAVVNLGSGSSGTIGQLASLTKYDLTSSSASLNVVTIPRTGSFTDAVMFLEKDSNNSVGWKIQHGTLYVEYAVGGVVTDITSFAYSSSTHAYWRIREASGTTFWDTSSDGSTWTNRASLANPIALTSLTVFLFSRCWEAETSPGTYQFKAFNS